MEVTRRIGSTEGMKKKEVSTRGGAFPSIRRRTFDTRRVGVEASISNPADGVFNFDGKRRQSLDRLGTRRERRGRDRTGATVATIMNSRNSGGSVVTLCCLFLSFSIFFLSDQGTMMMMTRKTE